jgi:uncharacterized LabA/DUF88 family protein
VDRCALFVDAGYVLADGAMAVHGTSHRESVSWDYAGLLQFFANLSADRTGQQLLRCYWYEATVDGRRSPEHDTLADLPGLMLRLGRMRPGKREGVETEIHRDLTTLARNRAISDVLLVSAEEDLAQVIADVQDLGVRVTIVHISVDGNWTVSRSLRQQCDDIVEIDSTQLRPYVELIAGAEPARYSEQYAAGGYGGKPLANGHAASVGGSGHGLASGGTGSHPAPPAIYTAPVVAEYQSPAQPAAEYQPPAAEYQPPARPAARQSPAPSPEPAPAMDAGPAEPNARGMHRGHAAASPQQQGSSPGPQGSQPAAAETRQSVPEPYPVPAPASFLEPARPATPPGQDLASAQQGSPGSASAPSGAPGPQGTPGPQGAPPPSSGQRAAGPRPPYAPAQPGSFAEPAGSQFSSAPPEQFSSAPPSLPARRGAQANGLQPNGPQGQRGPKPARPQQGSRSHQAQRPAGAAAGYVPQQGPYSAQMPGHSPAGRLSSAGVSLADSVQAAHSEGFEFGESVARDAPGLWLEAVLARKPRMPSDLEARLLQGSALPIDSLLHDEVRHALRRGFWDALERSRR